MADSVGIQAVAGFALDHGLYGAGPAIVYPDDPPGATQIAAGEQVPFSSESLTKATERAHDSALVGSGIARPAEVATEAISGAIEGPLRYRGWERLTYCGTGFEHPDNSPAFVGTPGAGKAISDATNTSPIVITSATHGYVTGDGVRVSGVVGNTAANGDWVIKVILPTTFELVGSTGNGVYVSGGTAEKFSAFAHLFELDEVLQDQAWVAGTERLAGFNAGDRKVRRGVVGFSKGQTNDQAFSSCMIDKITLSGNPTEVRVAFDLLGYNRRAGSYNSANWTLPGVSTALAIFHQATVKLGTRAAGYGSLSTFKPSAWELSVANNLKGDDRSTASAPYIEQPERNNFRETALKLDFPRFGPDAVTLQSYADLGTELSGYIELVGPQIGATGYYHLWGFYMSSLRIKETEPGNIGGPSVLTYSIELQAHRPGGSDIFVGNKHAGITLVKDGELVIVTQNEDPADYATEV